MDKITGILKSAGVSLEPDVSAEDLAKINKYALKPLSGEEVFVFKLMAGDNQPDDRNHEPFNAKAIEDMAKLYPGFPVIKNHESWDCDNQIARVFDASVKETGRKTAAGEPLKQLILKCYMLKNEANAALIADIEAGIKREVSTNCRAEHLYCSVCGQDNMKRYCAHYPGVTYNTKDGDKQCLMTIDGVKSVYEVSFVTIPAQPRAGTVKHYQPESVPIGTDPDEPEGNKSEKAAEELALAISISEAFLMAAERED